jgi:transcriptional regulator with XRE-family HTH domain
MPRRSTPNPLALAIGQRIKQLRLEQGLTAEKLAYESDVGSKGFLSDIESGLALPSLSTLERIAQRLEVPLFELLISPTRSEREALVSLSRHVPKSAILSALREFQKYESQAHLSSRAPLHPLRAYPTLEVAAGWKSPALAGNEPTAQSVRLSGRFNKSCDFAVRASGNSMHGFRSLITSGDWLVMRHCRDSVSNVVGQVVLLSREDRYGDTSLHLKRVVQVGKKYVFRSDDPEVPPMPVTDNDAILATLRSVVTPSALAPAPKTRFSRSKLRATFGLSKAPEAPFSRVDGHLFFLLKPVEIAAPSWTSVAMVKPNPAETAFVLSLSGSELTYVGVAAFDESRNNWVLRDAQT